jgi:hypothetical protein
MMILLATAGEINFSKRDITRQLPLLFHFLFPGQCFSFGTRSTP